MSPDQVVRAWKDADYNAALGAEGVATVPAHPVGPIELVDPALDIAGASVANTTEYLETLGCCQGLTSSMCDITAGMPGLCTLFCFTIFWTTSSICNPK